MGGICLAARPPQNFLWFLARVSIECYQAILAFVFLCTAFSAQLVGGAAGEALALGAFTDGLDIGQPAAFRTKFRQGGTGENQGKGE